MSRSLTCTRCHREPGLPRRDRAERVLCDACASLPPLVDYLNPPAPVSDEAFFTGIATRRNGAKAPEGAGNTGTLTNDAVEPNPGVVPFPDPRGKRGTTTPVDRYAGRVYAADVMTELVGRPARPTAWRVKGLVADGTATVFAAEAGLGKSVLMQALCNGVTHGREVAGFECAKGVALYVDGEMGTQMFTDRLRDMGVKSVPFTYVDAFGLDISVAKPDDLGWIRAHIESIGARFVVIDSLRRLMPSKRENESDDMAPAVGAVTKLARDTGAAVVLVHHKGDGEKAYRGSSAIKDQADALFAMLRANPDDEGDERCRITVRPAGTKHPRYAAAPPDRYVTVNFTDGGVVAVDAPEPPGPKVSAQDACMTAIRAAMPVGTKTQGAEKVGRKLQDTTFSNAWNALERLGEIAKGDGGWDLGSSRQTLGERDHYNPEHEGGS